MKKKTVKCSYCESELRRMPTKTDTYFCGFDCKAKWQVGQREKLGFTKDWLYDQYFNQGKTCNDIARGIGRDPKRVWGWFNQYGIKLNSRGGKSSSGSFKKGESIWWGRKHKQETKDKIREVRIKDGHVPYLRNGEHWLKSVDTKYHPNYKGGITPERLQVYSSIEWVDAVKKVWKRDNATCQRCGKHQSQEKEVKFNIHHIVSFANKDLRTDPNNLVLLCFKCHKWVHSKANKNKQFIKQ